MAGSRHLPTLDSLLPHTLLHCSRGETIPRWLLCGQNPWLASLLGGLGEMTPRMDGWMDRWVGGWVEGWMGGWIKMKG
jgi:hypothetical protein